MESVVRVLCVLFDFSRFNGCHIDDFLASFFLSIYFFSICMSIVEKQGMFVFMKMVGKSDNWTCVSVNWVGA